MFAYVSSLRPPRFEGGMVAWMYRISSAVVRDPQALMKLPPASGGASFRPARSGRWQLAQLVWYEERPSAVAWLAPAGVWLRPQTTVIGTTAIIARSGARKRDTSAGHSIAKAQSVIVVVAAPAVKLSSPQLRDSIMPSPRSVQVQLRPGWCWGVILGRRNGDGGFCKTSR